ncbi:MAG: hypothetical protein ACE5HU_05875 [Acidobacteriota bacterium]
MKTHEDGFSLVEVIVAAGLMAAALMMTGAAFSVGGRTIVSARQDGLATIAAQRVLEDLLRPARGELPVLVQGAPADPNAGAIGGDSRDAGSPLDRFLRGPARAGLEDGFVTVRLAPLGYGGSNGSFATAEALSIRIVVGWRFLGAARTVVLEAVRS